MWRIAANGGVEQPDGSILDQCPHTLDPIQRLFHRSYLSFQISSPLIATQPSRLTTLIDIARQAHHAWLAVSGFAVAISSARLGSIVPRTVAHHRLNPPLLLCRSENDQATVRHRPGVDQSAFSDRSRASAKGHVRARRPCTRRARSMRLPRTRKPPDEHCAVGRVRSQRHQSAARDRTIVFSDAPHGPSFLRTIPTIQTWKRGAVGAENVAPFSRAACDIPVA
jgi:hypothetical protein